MAHDIFISYSRKDSAIVDRIEEELNKYGITSFVYRSTINKGDGAAKIIVNALNECKIVLFVWSENSANPDRYEYTLKEVMLSLNLKKTVVPFRIGKFSYSDLDFYLATSNIIIIETFNEIETVKLGKELARILKM